MDFITPWRDKFRKLPLVSSLRKQYVFLAILLATVVLIYTWVAGSKVAETGETTAFNIEQRIKVADLTHRIRRSIVAAENSLNLYLLSPSESSRVTFHEQLNQAKANLDSLLAINWVTETHMLSMLHGLKPTVASMESAGEEVMKVRQNANLMYPAMRLANGQMMEDNMTFLVEANNAIYVMKSKPRERLRGFEVDMQQRLYDARDVWHRMISSYRLYLINRIGSLHEDVLRSQASDVDQLYEVLREQMKNLSRIAVKKNVDIEIAGAIDLMNETSLRWYEGYKEVVRINTEGQWRGDVPIMKDTLHPLLSQLYEKLDQLEDELKNSADADLVEQSNMGDEVSYSLWGMAGFVLVISLLSLLVLEFNFIRPIASVARSLKNEAEGKAEESLPDVQTTEIRDLTDAFRELRQQIHSRQMALEHIALHDSLTSLPNRVLLMDRLNQAIESGRKRQRTLALIMLDLDRFKEINDTLGHQTGDALLQQVGARLRGVLRDSDTVARLGGDEFAILLNNINETNALRIAAAIHEALEKVYEVYEHSLYVGVSLGIAVFPHHGDTADVLLQHADVAMYMAKRSNTGITLYDTTRDQHSVSQLSVLSDLREAIENDEFFIEYQPKLAMHDGKISDVEALLRWRHPVHGLVKPDDFIPTAEQTGLIKRISPWMLEHAIRDIKRLHDKGNDIGVSVNLSVWDIQDVNLATTIRNLLQEANLSPKYLTLEITERVMMAEPERARAMLKEIDEMGVQIGIDDFGTGFSSLVYLTQLPVDTLKIDKSFVMGMLKDESHSAIVHSIIELAHNLGLAVIAEGVENDQTWSWLKKWHCDYAQGFYISHPLPYAELEKYLHSFEKQGLYG